MAPGVNAQLVKDLVAELTIRSQGFTRFDDLVQFTEVYKTIQKLLKAQKKKQEEPPLTEHDFKNFYKWLAENGVKWNDTVEVAKFEGMGYGLKAKRDLKEGELLVEVPRKAMITERSILSTKLEPFVSKDRVLSNPSVGLALFLVHEKLNPNSFFAPYIKVLPRTFDLPFYFTLEELCALKGSPLLHQCFQTIVLAARQYCLFHKILQDNPQVMSSFSFHLADYLWAVSCVMTRQNRVPDAPSEKGPGGHIIALIPFWDFANHKGTGYLSTFFDDESNTIKCASMSDCKKNEQVYIYYGNRDNRDFFMYSGFVTQDNKFDSVSVSMSPGDVSDPPALTKRKQAVFESLGLRSELAVTLSGRFLPSEYLLFGGILSLSDEELTKIFGPNLDQVKTPEEALKLVDAHARPFLAKKVEEWLTAYPKEENQKDAALSVHTKNAIFMWTQEKKILTNTLALLTSSKPLSELTSDPSPPQVQKKEIIITPPPSSSSSSSTPSSTGAAKKKKKKSKKQAKAKEPEVVLDLTEG